MSRSRSRFCFKVGGNFAKNTGNQAVAGFLTVESVGFDQLNVIDNNIVGGVRGMNSYFKK